MDSQSPQHDARVERASSKNIGPDDSRYAALNRRGFNKRFEGRPDYIRLVGSTQDVIDAVQLAVTSGLRLAVLAIATMITITKKSNSIGEEPRPTLKPIMCDLPRVDGIATERTAQTAQSLPPSCRARQMRQLSIPPS